jgi:TRAP-type C4-dicarboxylate transport system substrate-binding protein
MLRGRASVVVGLGALALALFAPRPAGARTELRLATILPAGSSWAKELDRLARQVKSRSRGELAVRIFGGAIMGDERDTVRKMDRGALEAAAVTSVGLGMLVPSLRVLELPLMFETTAELDRVRDALTPELAAEFKARGYQLLGWGDVGWVSLYTARAVRSVADVRAIKVWSWTDDPMARALVRRFGARCVPLAVQDVLPALQTGLIDSCYGSPYTMIALQWYTKVRYVLARPITYAVGALVVTQRAFAALPPRLQRLLADEASAMTKRFVQRSRDDNVAAQRQLRQLGVKELAIPADVMAMMRRESAALANELAGKLYSKQLLGRVLALRAKARQQ